MIFRETPVLESPVFEAAGIYHESLLFFMIFLVNFAELFTIPFFQNASNDCLKQFIRSTSPLAPLIITCFKYYGDFALCFQKIYLRRGDIFSGGIEREHWPKMGQQDMLKKSSKNGKEQNTLILVSRYFLAVMAKVLFLEV